MEETGEEQPNYNATKQVHGSGENGSKVSGPKLHSTNYHMLSKL